MAAAKSKNFYRENKTDKVWWVDDPEVRGVWEFSFDRQTIFNLFEDYPWKLTPEQKKLFVLLGEKLPEEKSLIQEYNPEIRIEQITKAFELALSTDFVNNSSGFLLIPALTNRFVFICLRSSLTLQLHFIHSVS